MNEWINDRWVSDDFGVDNLGFAKRVKDDEGRWEEKGKGKWLAFLSCLFCSPRLSAIKLSFHFIKSLLSIQYALGTLLDAGNTKMKIKQNKTTVQQILNPIYSFLRKCCILKRQSAWVPVREPKIFSFWPFIEKTCQLLIRLWSIGAEEILGVFPLENLGNEIRVV